MPPQGPESMVGGQEVKPASPESQGKALWPRGGRRQSCPWTEAHGPNPSQGTSLRADEKVSTRTMGPGPSLRARAQPEDSPGEPSPPALGWELGLACSQTRCCSCISCTSQGSQGGPPFLPGTRSSVSSLSAEALPACHALTSESLPRRPGPEARPLPSSFSSLFL